MSLPNRESGSFAQAILQKLTEVPPGRVTTYSDLARAAGYPGAARAAGNALNRNPLIKVVPCHRVVLSDGRLGGFALGAETKAKYLQDEGVIIKNNRVVDFLAIKHLFK